MEGSTSVDAASVFERIRQHAFHPIDDRNFTIDRDLGEDGIARLDDRDWQVRLTATADLVRADSSESAALAVGLDDDDVHVRFITAKAAGIRGDTSVIDPLIEALESDPRGVVRAQAAMSLGQLGAGRALPALRTANESDDRDVSHQAELAIAQIERDMVATAELREAYASVDRDRFGQVGAGDSAPAFELPTTDATTWRLDETDGWTLLVWVFADWCPVCHREFDELIELRHRLDELGVEVATVECHDTFRGRVMVGRELEPSYWFAEESFQERYTARIWWPHLLDRAGAVGATYGVDPFAFAVHAEFINRPGTFVIDPDGVVRLAYIGTFWGDRPSIEETLEMIAEERFEFEHPDRLHPPG